MKSDYKSSKRQSISKSNMKDGSDLSIIKVEKKRNYVSIDNGLFENPSLSWRAKGLLGDLLSRPPDWEVRIADLISRCPEGRDAIYAIVKELQKAGHIIRDAVRNENGRFIFSRYTVYEESQLAADPEKSTTSGKAGYGESGYGKTRYGLTGSGSTGSGESDTTNTNINNTKITKKNDNNKNGKNIPLSSAELPERKNNENNLANDLQNKSPVRDIAVSDDIELSLIREDQRDNEGLIDEVRKAIAKHGKAYIANNIKYANRNAQENYPAYLSMALNRNFAKYYQETNPKPPPAEIKTILAQLKPNKKIKYKSGAVFEVDDYGYVKIIGGKGYTTINQVARDIIAGIAEIEFVEENLKQENE